MYIWFRTWQLGVKSLLLHPLRSLLTVLGIFIGVSSDNYSAVLENHFEGDRCSIREQVADKALLLALSAAEKL